MHSRANFPKQILFLRVSLLRLFCREFLGSKYKQNMCHPSTSGSHYKLQLEWRQENDPGPRKAQPNVTGALNTKMILASSLVFTVPVSSPMN